jgi:hypothetical protein
VLSKRLLHARGNLQRRMAIVKKKCSTFILDVYAWGAALFAGILENYGYL